MTYKDAGQVAHGLIQAYIGPDHRVMDMASFYGALVQALHRPISMAGRIAARRRWAGKVGKAANITRDSRDHLGWG